MCAFGSGRSVLMFVVAGSVLTGLLIRGGTGLPGRVDLFAVTAVVVVVAAVMVGIGVWFRFV